MNRLACPRHGGRAPHPGISHAELHALIDVGDRHMCALLHQPALADEHRLRPDDLAKVAILCHAIGQHSVCVMHLQPNTTILTVCFETIRQSQERGCHSTRSQTLQPARPTDLVPINFCIKTQQVVQSQSPAICTRRLPSASLRNHWGAIRMLRYVDALTCRWQDRQGVGS